MEENFLCGLDNEQENVFLAAVDFENVIITGKVDTVTVEKADGCTKVKKHRFANQIKEIQYSPVKLSVKGLFRYPIKCFE